MTPLDLTSRHPRLFHITTPGAWENIRRHGLLSTSKILDLFDIKSAYRDALESQRREKEVPLFHTYYGSWILNDNQPLTEKALTQCLDDSLSPREWLKMLNARVFFWTTEESLQQHLNARLNRQRSREIIVIDTMKLAADYAENMELCPINSGSTIRKPARRGLKTFTPLLRHSFEEWRKLRGKQDNIREITVREGIMNVEKYVLNVYRKSSG